MAKDLRYLAVLCVAALLVLFAGVWFRPAKVTAPVRSESDLLQLQLAAQRRDFDRRTLFLRTKARELAPSVPDARTQTARPPFRPPEPGESLLLVASDALWANASTAGVASADCGPFQAQEIGTTMTIPATLADAVAFDLDNNLAGIVIPCGGRLILTTPESFDAWTALRALDQRLVDCCGVQVAPTGAEELEVIEVGENSPMARAGLKVGDRILSPASKQDLISATELVVRRGDRARKLKLQVAP